MGSRLRNNKKINNSANCKDSRIILWDTIYQIYHMLIFRASWQFFLSWWLYNLDAYHMMKIPSSVKYWFRYHWMPFLMLLENYLSNSLTCTVKQWLMFHSCTHLCTIHEILEKEENVNRFWGRFHCVFHHCDNMYIVCVLIVSTSDTSIISSYIFLGWQESWYNSIYPCILTQSVSLNLVKT